MKEIIDLDVDDQNARLCMQQLQKEEIYLTCSKNEKDGCIEPKK